MSVASHPVAGSGAGPAPADWPSDKPAHKATHEPAHEPARAVRPRLVTVFGATGTVGREVVAELAAAGHHVRAVTRSPNRVLPPVRHRPPAVGHVLASADNPDQVRRACRHADAVFVAVGTHPGQVDAECAIIDGAVAAGVGRIVKLSAPRIAGAPPMAVAEWHRRIEDHLAGAPIESIALRPMAFAQNWLRNTFPITHFDTISGSAGDAPRSYVDARDVAAVAARALVAPQPPVSTAIAIDGPTAYSYGEVAALLSEVTGRTIRHQHLDPAEHHRMLTSRAKLPGWLADHIVELDTLARTVPDTGSDVVARILGRPARTLEDVLFDNRRAFARPTLPRRLAGLLRSSL